MAPLPEPAKKADLLGLTKKREDSLKAAKQADAAKAAQRAAAEATRIREEEVEAAIEDTATWLPAALQPSRAPPARTEPAPTLSEIGGSSFSFGSLLEESCEGQGPWENPADAWKEGRLDTPNDEQSIDDELAAAEAKVAELRRLKAIRATGGEGKAAPKPPAAQRNNEAEDRARIRTPTLAAAPPSSNGGGGSLWGSFDEQAMEAGFKDAVSEWRGEPEAEKAAAQQRGPPKYGGSLWGDYDEGANEAGFKDAVSEWRGDPEEKGAEPTNEAGQQALTREKRSCWQCYKLHWSDVSLTEEGHLDKLFCGQKCLGKFQGKEKEKAAKKKASEDKAACERVTLAAAAAAASP